MLTYQPRALDEASEQGTKGVDASSIETLSETRSQLTMSFGTRAGVAKTKLAKGCTWREAPMTMSK